MPEKHPVEGSGDRFKGKCALQQRHCQRRACRHSGIRGWRRAQHEIVGGKIFWSLALGAFDLCLAQGRFNSSSTSRPTATKIKPLTQWVGGFLLGGAMSLRSTCSTLSAPRLE
jgi:hypothetical protein